MVEEVFKKLDAGTDSNLGAYFARTTAIDELARFGSQKVVAVGLKGVGKTAAYRYFTEFEKGADIVIGINPDKFLLYLPDTKLNYATTRKQFEHDLVMEALRTVTQNRSSLGKKVKKPLLDKAAGQVSSYTDKLKAAAGRFGGISILGFGFTIHHPDMPVAVGLREERDITDASNILKEICAGGVKIRIVVDDPEHVFSSSRELDTHLIGGFCLAALRLSDAIPGFKVIVLIKSHVYYPVLLDVDDLRKYPDHMGRLCWTKEELVDVVGKRLKWIGSGWTGFFEGTEKDVRQMVERMCGYVRNGPRDLLRWIDLSNQAFKGAKISERSVSQTRNRMSLDSLGEFETAHNSSYPKIGAVLKVIFRDDPGHKYSLAELKAHIKNLLIKNSEMKALSKMTWMQFETNQSIPKLLFETGAIAFEFKGQVILPYEEGYHNENFGAASSIFLVPTFIEAMS